MNSSYWEIVITIKDSNGLGMTNTKSVKECKSIDNYIGNYLLAMAVHGVDICNLDIKRTLIERN